VSEKCDKKSSYGIKNTPSSAETKLAYLFKLSVHKLDLSEYAPFHSPAS
jgi:hypothetical protein